MYDIICWLCIIHSVEFVKDLFLISMSFKAIRMHLENWSRSFQEGGGVKIEHILGWFKANKQLR